MKNHPQKGLTLIEVILAIAISGLLIVVLFSVLSSILKTERRLGRFNRLNQSVNYIFTQITEDVRWSDKIIIENSGTKLITIYHDDAGNEISRSIYELTANNITLTRPDETTNIPTTHTLISPEIEIQELEFSDLSDSDHRPLIKTIIAVKSPGFNQEEIHLEREITISNIQKNIEIKQIDSINPPTPTPTPEIIVTPGVATPTPTIAPPPPNNFPQITPHGYGKITFTPGTYLVRWHSVANGFENFLKNNNVNYIRTNQTPFLAENGQPDGLMAFYEYKLSGFNSLTYDFNASGYHFGLYECLSNCQNLKSYRSLVNNTRTYTIGDISANNIRSFNYQMIDTYNNKSGFAILKVIQSNGTEEIIRHLPSSTSPDNDLVNLDIKIPNNITTGKLVLVVNGSFGIWFTTSSNYVQPTPIPPPIYIPD